jgi:hypothetical protein
VHVKICPPRLLPGYKICGLIEKVLKCHVVAKFWFEWSELRRESEHAGQTTIGTKLEGGGGVGLDYRGTTLNLQGPG